MKETTETSLVSQEENNKPAINSEQAAAGFFAGSGAGFNMWTSLPLEDKKAIVKALGDSDHNLRDFCREGGVVNLANVLSHFVQLESDETGEITEEARIVLIDKDGKTYSTTARGARSSLGNLFNIYGLPPYDPAITIKAREVKTRKGRYTLNIVPV